MKKQLALLTAIFVLLLGNAFSQCWQHGGN